MNAFSDTMWNDAIQLVKYIGKRGGKLQNGLKVAKKVHLVYFIIYIFFLVRSQICNFTETIRKQFAAVAQRDRK